MAHPLGVVDPEHHAEWWLARILGASKIPVGQLVVGVVGEKAGPAAVAGKHGECLRVDATRVQVQGYWRIITNPRRLAKAAWVLLR